MKMLKLISFSNAGDKGYQALADVAVAARGLDYRIVGGHMVQLLIHAYPTPEATERSTTDADAGIDRLTAVGQNLHAALLARGYQAETGNRYIRGTGTEGEDTIVDLLIPLGTAGRTEVLNERGFDMAPGLSMALNAPALQVEATVLLSGGGDLRFTVPIPDVEAALVLKALAWNSRGVDKDLTDVASLLEILHRHKPALSRWWFDDPLRANRGERRDAAAALHQLVKAADGGRLQAGHSGVKPARLAALIREHIPAPTADRR